LFFTSPIFYQTRKQNKTISCQSAKKAC